MASGSAAALSLNQMRLLTRQCSADFSSGKITFTGTPSGSDKHRLTLTMAWHPSVSWFVRLSLILTVISLLLNIVAFVSPFWMHVEDALGTSYSGLWTVCIFEVCGDFLHHSMFLWFHVVQAMMCLSLLCQLLVLFSTLFYIVAPVSPSNSVTILKTVGLEAVFADVSAVTGVLVYGVEQGQQRGVDTLSWGFILAAVSSAIMVVTTVFIVLELRRTSQGCEDGRPMITPTLKGSQGIAPSASLHHSPSSQALRTEEKPSALADNKPVRLARPRSESHVRMRVNSVSQECPPTPMPGEVEQQSGAVFDFDYDNECFAP